jgi:hypothetical protein
MSRVALLPIVKWLTMFACKAWVGGGRVPPSLSVPGGSCQENSNGIESTALQNVCYIRDEISDRLPLPSASPQRQKPHAGPMRKARLTLTSKPAATRYSTTIVCTIHSSKHGPTPIPTQPASPPKPTTSPGPPTHPAPTPSAVPTTAPLRARPTTTTPAFGPRNINAGSASHRPFPPCGSDPDRAAGSAGVRCRRSHDPPARTA